MPLSPNESSPAPASPPRARPTISDVARHCGLSKATVSKVLNLAPEVCPIAEATRGKVLAAVEELGYRPSWQARSLANRRTGMIAIVNADPLGALPRGLYWDMVDELDSLLSDAGLVPTFIHTYEGNPRAPGLLGDQRFDGCLCLDRQPAEVMDALRRDNVPTVLVNADADRSWTQIRYDDKSGTEQVMRHLIGLGHRRIAYNAGRRPNTHSSAIIRAATYAQCMRDSGLEPDKPFVGPVEAFVERCLDGPYKPTAVLDYEHWTAVRVLQQVWRRGRRVPDDLSLATFNDTYPVSLLTPPLTAVALPERPAAKLAVAMLQELIDRPATAPRDVLLEQTLVPRESTTAPSESAA